MNAYCLGLGLGLDPKVNWLRSLYKIETDTKPWTFTYHYSMITLLTPRLVVYAQLSPNNIQLSRPIDPVVVLSWVNARPALWCCRVAVVCRMPPRVSPAVVYTEVTRGRPHRGCWPLVTPSSAKNKPFLSLRPRWSLVYHTETLLAPPPSSHYLTKQVCERSRP